MSLRYFVQRMGAFLLTIIVAATLNFAIPRMSPQDPVAALTGKMASKGKLVQGGEQLIAQYRQEFGLDRPLIVQYGDYMQKLFFHGDMGYSLAYFPTKVSTVVLRAVPWSLGLLLFANLLAFVIGNLFGALAAWRTSPKLVKCLVYALMPLSSIPYYILALILVYTLAMTIPVFPLTGTFTLGSARGFDWPTIKDLALHSALPVLSIALSLVGFWALSMRGTMTMVLGEDYLTYARSKGLKETRIFGRYAMRNAMLPQFTALAIDLGRMISGAVLVEIIFNYPGVGEVLFNALRTADYFVIQGVVMFIIFSVALATLIVDLTYPILDPRIRYQ
jgi:peptide/nickel transport system permease protein